MALKLHAGELKRMVVLKRPTDVRNTEGGKERTFESAGEVRAKIERSNLKSEQGRGGSITTDLLYTDTVYMRYASDRAELSEDWLLTYDGLNHIIHGIEYLGTERNEWIKVTVRAAEGSLASGSTGGSTGGGGTTPDPADTSHLALTFTLTEPATVVLSIDKTSGTDISSVEWGDGDTDSIPAGTNAFATHDYEAGTYACKFYPVEGLTNPAAPAVNKIQSISIEKVGAGVSTVVGVSLSWCKYLRRFEANGMGLTALPAMPNSGEDQVRFVSVTSNELTGDELSELLIELNAIGWPVGYLSITDNPGSLTTAGETAKTALLNKGWTVNG